MKKYFLCLLTITFALVIFSNTISFGQGSCSDGSYNFADVSAILNSSTCDNCHLSGSSGNWNYSTYAGALAAGNCGVANVVPGNALGSLLYDKIDGNGTVSCGGAMPNGMPPTAAAFNAADLAAIEAWINAGALELCPPPSTCPTVILNDNNLPSLPPAVCADDLLSLCFDVTVDEATFDPTLVQFNYNLTLAGAPSAVVLNTTYTSGGGIDPNATGQLCFETTVPVGTDFCAPYELSLEIVDVFYLDADCPDNFVAFDLDITTPITIMQTGDNLNDLIPLLTVAGLNPILVQIYPNPNWSANVVQLPACDGATLGTIEILAADGTTVCETLTDVGTAGMDGCPKTDAILPETLYENYTTFIDADSIEQVNPCAISLTIPEQIVTCVDECINTCPTVILNDNNLPSLPPAVCADDLLSLCFDVTVDEATFDPTLVQFNYNLTLAGAPSAVVLNTTYTSGGGIDPNATGQLCFETTVPVGTDFCAPYELSLEIVDVFYLDADCPDNFVAFDLDITTPITIMQTGDNLNDLIPLLTVAGLNPILVQIYPNPNWSANVVQLPACDGATLGTIEILAADGTTVCETLTDVGTAGMDGCPKTDAILPETLYENYTTFIDADSIEQVNPCAISLTIPEQIVTCVDECIICPTVVSVDPPNNICPDGTEVAFCVEFDVMVDANTVLTVEGVNVDGSAGGTQICVDVPFTAPFNPCEGAAIDYDATAICDGVDLLDGLVWLSSQILPITDPSCGGIAGCTDINACNYNPDAVCDDPNDPCLPAPICNTDPCVGDIEIIDPADACTCIVDVPQVLGCTDATACNFDATANCDNATCDFGDATCADPCNPVSGCTDPAACNFDPSACIDDGMCAAPPCNPGCTDPCADNFDVNADADDGSCIPYDDTCNADCTMGPFGGIYDAATCACINEVIPVNGCTDASANNFDPNANCDDGNCMFDMCDDPCAPNFGAVGACDPYDDTCNADCTMGPFGGIYDATTCSCINEITPVNGCTDASANNFDPNANCDDGNCMFDMCDDPCAPNFGAVGACDPYDDTCNADCTVGPFGGTWDATTCSCINEVTPVNGCTDASANNFDPNANCDDGNCMFDMCDDPCAPNFGDAGACDPYDDTCNADCTMGPFGGTWDTTSCSCINEITPVNGCTDASANNFDPNANCDDGSCISTCEEEINGAVVVSDPACDISGINIIILAPDGTSITVTTNASGSFSVPGGPFPCGDYTAAFADISSLPVCYATTGSTDPIVFTIDGVGGGNDGPFFFSNPEIPTLSQWGLISLALLMMIFGALKLSFTSENIGSFYRK